MLTGTAPKDAPAVIPYFRPSINESDIARVAECLRNGWLTSGSRVALLESTFAEMAGVKHAIALNSCTAGILLGLIALNVGPGDEVILPSLSFVAAANCVLQLGATPVFCDVSPRTLACSPATIEPHISASTKAIVAMQYAGAPIGIREICALAKRHGIALLEDAALSVGMQDRGSWAGEHSDGAAYSFYATKNITSAEGGIFVTQRDDVAQRVRSHALHGLSRDAWKRHETARPWQYDVETIGHKANLADPLAALVLSQLGRLEELQARRDRLASFYNQLFEAVDGIEPVAPELGPEDRHSWCFYAVRIDPDRTGYTRDDAIEYLRARGIGTSVHYIPTHRFRAYGAFAGVDLPATERAFPELLSLPLFPDMSMAQAEYVALTLKKTTAVARLAGKGARI